MYLYFYMYVYLCIIIVWLSVLFVGRVSRLSMFLLRSKILVLALAQHDSALVSEDVRVIVETFFPTERTY